MLWVANAGNAVEAHKLLTSTSEPASSYEFVLLAITYTLLSQQTQLLTSEHHNPTVFFAVSSPHCARRLSGIFSDLLCSSLFLAQLASCLYKLVKCCLSVCRPLCLDGNQSDTNRNRCTQRLVILHVQTYQ